MNQKRKLSFSGSGFNWAARMPVVLAFSSLVTAALLAIRVVMTGHTQFLFLGWNLYLAWVPMAFALAVHQSGWIRNQPHTFYSCLFLWLITFPNAPYLITDLAHLFYAIRHRPTMIWYDSVLFFSAVWNGVILGFTSLYLAQEAIAEKWKSGGGWVAAGLSILAGSYAIYLGRVERWNSWDIFVNPEGILRDVYHHFRDVFTRPRPVLFTMLFTVVLSAGYLTFRIIASRRSAHSGNSR